MKWPRGEKRKGARSPEVQIVPRRPRRLRDRIPDWVEITAGIVAILVGGYTLAPVVKGFFEDSKLVEVELAEVTVSNPRKVYAGLGQTPETEPTVTATVRNNGERTAWVDEARISLLDGTRIPICFTQGGGPDVPHSKPYRVTLPEFPNAEKLVIRHPLHVEVQPGHGARPLLRFQKLLSSASALYAIDVKYVVDPGKEVLDAGRFVIGVPGPPERGGYVLPESEVALTDEEEFRKAGAKVSPLTSWCLQHNLAGVQRLAAEPGRRSAEIAALSHLQPAPAWQEIKDHESPRQAVETLLGAEDLDSPMYAVEAAAETGDPAYEEQVRKRAIAILIKSAEEDLGDAATLSIGAAERALSLEHNEAASDLLAEAKVAATAQEERLEKEVEEESVVASGE